MARIPESSPWAQVFVGKVFDKEKALAQEWYDQGSKNFHFGLPVGKNFWVKRNNTAGHCGCHTIWIFLLVSLAEDGTIRWVGEQISQVFNDGHGEVIDVPLFPQDSAAAVEELRKVTVEPEAVKPAVKPPSQKKKVGERKAKIG